jgi:hypothetical protein
MGFSLVLVLLLVSSNLVAQKPHHAARWIDGLKNTSADDLGTGLPHEKFAVWFADLAKPDKIAYAVEECDLHDPSTGVTDRVFCVNAYTKPPHPGWNRWIQLSFIVGSIPTGEAPAKDPGTKWVGYIFQRGIETPADPKMSRPDRVFSELSDLVEIVSDSHPTNTARLEGHATRGRGRAP